MRREVFGVGEGWDEENGIDGSRLSHAVVEEQHPHPKSTQVPPKTTN